MTLGFDSMAVAAAERIRAQAGARVHRLGEPDELKEEAMPRKKKDDWPEVLYATKITDPIAPKKRGMKPGVTYKSARVTASGPIFGVFDDGSVTLALPKCTGNLGPEEVRQFLDFLKRIGVKA